jgi:hypothetical protein
VLLTSNAVQYTLNQLFAIALPAVEWRIAKVDKEGVEVGILNERSLYFNVLDEYKRKQLLAGDLTPAYVLSFDNHTEIPFFPIEKTENFYKKSKNSIIFTCDLITLPFLLLSNHDNYPVATRDQHDRQTYKNSLNEGYNIIDFPLVDHYAFFIRKVVSENFPNITIAPRTPKMIITHDIDELYRFPNFYKTIKTIFGGDLWTRKSFKFFQQSVKQLFKTLRNRINDPYISGMQQLIETTQKLQRNDIEQIVFVKGLKLNEPDATYDINSPILAQLIEYLKTKGVKIGLHGSYYSYDNPEIYKQEKARLATLTQQSITLGRQHFLRYHRTKTLHVWLQNGIVHDYTLGFAEREGFRCGTCHPYLVYDIENDCTTNIIEHPLIVMDGTFFQYRRITPEIAYRKMCRLYEACRQVEGDFVVLWHNTVVYREFEPWFRDCFCRFLEEKEIK